MAIIIFILVLSFLVIIHELGHYIAAKWAKVKVDEFGLGYPPKAIKLFRWRGTDFTINWIPFGGFVRMQGEEVSIDSDENDKSDQKKSITGQFYQVNPFKKMVIILAGASVNFVFGIIAFTIVFSNMGLPDIVKDARIGKIAPDSPAEHAGIPSDVNVTGFQVVDQDKITIESIDQVIEQVLSHKGETVTIFTSGHCEAKVCSESEMEYEVYLRTPEETPEGQGSIGVVFDQVVYTFYPVIEMPFRSALYGVEQAMFLGVQIVQAFSNLVTDLIFHGKISGDVAGPVGIVDQANTLGIFEEGWLTVLSFAGMLSINLAVMNILPIPPLDGGRALFIILELIFKKKNTEKIEYYLNYGGYIFLLGLIVFITIKDVLRIFGK